MSAPVREPTAAPSGPQTTLPHVAQVAAHYPPYVGGMERVTREISMRMVPHAQSVTVVTSDVGARRTARREVVDGVVVRRHRAVRIFGVTVAPGLFLGVLRLPRNSLVHVHVAHAFVLELVRIACWLRRFRYVVTFHLDVDRSGRLGWLLPTYKRFVLGPAMRAAARVIALTPHMAEFLVASYGVDQARVAVVGNGVDAHFAAGPRPDDDPAGPLRLVFVGRLVVQKNLARLLRCLPLVTAPVEVTLVGDGTERGALTDLAADLGLDNVRFVGERPHEEIATWLCWADAFVCTSDAEGMPLAILEALASGLPVVATASDGMPELIGDAGLVVEACPRALAAAIDRVAADPELLRAFAERTTARVAGRSWAAVAAETRRQYGLAGALS
jgi:glycosyltransferase involved in cell wall biosynthesis